MKSDAQQSPLESLQERFAILDLAGNIRLIDRHQVQAHFEGKRQPELSMYTKADADLKMKRHLEAMSVPSKPKEVIANFWPPSQKLSKLYF